MKKSKKPARRRSAAETQEPRSEVQASEKVKPQASSRRRSVSGVKQGAGTGANGTGANGTGALNTVLRVLPPQAVTIAPPEPAAASLTVAQGAEPQAQTIVYIHGIANKPPASVLKCQWDTALFGNSLGDRSRMAYWVNREYYPHPLEATCAAADTVRIDDDEVSTRTIMALSHEEPTGERQALEAEINALSGDAARREWLQRIAERMTSREDADDGTLQAAVGAAEVGARVLPLPAFLRKRITRRITRAYLRDVNDFFFNQERRRLMEQSLIERLNAGGGPFVVIAHSQGSMVAYNVLRQLARSECDVRLFVTIGSPLGMAEVQDVLKGWTGNGKLPFPPCVARWVNVAERLDPVAVDNRLAGEFKDETRGKARKIEDFAGLFLNPDSPRDPHSGTGYLRTSAVQNAVRETVGNAFGQAVGRSIITKDLSADLEDGTRRERHPVLIQLAGKGMQAPAASHYGDLTVIRDSLTGTITEMVKASGDGIETAEIEPLKRYLSAKLTRLEIERLRTQFSDLKIERIWRDAVKRALIYESTGTVQARPANLGYGALGKGIHWAVLDSGVRSDHPHFELYDNVVAQWDCTRRGEPVAVTSEQVEKIDRNGHGTHVAGVIAGQREVIMEDGKPGVLFSGMAPQASLYSFKVLNDQGRGQDSWIIKALDFIGDLNERAGRLVIHGVNLSLGGAFDPRVYGCGHTPLCQELRRLWGQGVLVCLAAGNEGYAVLQSDSGEVGSNLDLTIGDPANLEEAIAVGSVHKTNPHTFGVSYFSSRGPTADGRTKPDLVAPGEQILSALSDFAASSLPDGQYRAQELYVEMSGTSMATPHVSGILAAFLSMRQEFIGYPDRVKEILLENCTDLNRDSYFQGRGLPNLIKMLANT